LGSDSSRAFPLDCLLTTAGAGVAGRPTGAADRCFITTPPTIRAAPQSSITATLAATTAVFSNTRAGAFRRASIQARRVRASRAKVRAVQAAFVRKERGDRRDVRRDVQRGGRRGVQQDVRKQGALKRRVQKHVQRDVRQVVQQRQHGPQVGAAALVHKLMQRQRGLVEAEAAVMRHQQPTAAAVAEGTRSSNPLAHAPLVQSSSSRCSPVHDLRWSPGVLLARGSFFRQ